MNQYNEIKYNALLEKRKEFNQKRYDQFINLYLCKHKCTNCKSPKYVRHGSYPRHVYFSQVSSTVIQLVRVKCRSCDRTEVLRHPCIIKFKRYCLDFLVQLFVWYKQNRSSYGISRKFGLCRSHVRYLVKQFVAWHEFGLEVMQVALPPPDIASFSVDYKGRFLYEWMQIISS